MDFARLEREILKPFTDKEEIIRYGYFDAKREEISETIELQNNGKLVVEGVGLFRPELMDYFTYTIWVDCLLGTAIERGKKRDREEYRSPTDDLWDGIWKENDLQYMETFNPPKKANLVVDNS